VTSTAALQAALGICKALAGVFLNYTDPVPLRAASLSGLPHWQGPRLPVCGDLHHGTRPSETLATYLDDIPNDARLIGSW
jgi:hypothetical protein